MSTPTPEPTAPPPERQFTPLSPAVLEALGADFCVPRKAGDAVDVRHEILIMKADEDALYVAGLDRRGISPSLWEQIVNDHALYPVLIELFQVNPDTATIVCDVATWCAEEMAFSFDRKHPRG